MCEQLNEINKDTENPKREQRVQAMFDVNGRTKITRFGTSSNFVLNPNKTTRDRTNYM